MKRYSLNRNWVLSRVRHTGTFYQETVFPSLDGEAASLAMDSFPAQVHDVLLAHGEIENPNLTGRNPYLWIDDYDWVYTCRFSVAEPDLPSRLLFHGLDTFCRVWLNGVQVGNFQNVYMEHMTEELTCLKRENELVIYFYSPKATVDEMEEHPEYAPYVPKTCAVRAFRSGFHDYCGPIPELIRCGIYGEVELLQRQSVRITEPKIDVSVAESLDSGRIRVQFQLEGGSGEVPCCLRLFEQDGRLAAEKYSVCQDGSGAVSFEIAQPKLWYPFTHGQPYCYRLELEAGGKDGDRISRTVAFRRLEQAGEFDYRVNGKPLKLWGVNLTHPDTLSNCYREKKMNRLLDLAQLAHCNIIRVWGESEAYPDTFYEECDRRGILIWQDFYLCYSMYSEEASFMEECRIEAEQLVKRLRHHPSILLWCGGNEMLLSRDYDFPGHYCYGERIIREVYPEVCRRLDPERYYHVSSPSGGRWANDPSAGDTHGYTHLWFVPGRNYPLFLSENCRVSAPSMKSMRRMMTAEELWPQGYDTRITPEHRLPWPDTWSAHNTNQGDIKLGPVEHYYDARTPEELVYRIGAAHAEYIRRDMERFRRGYSAEGRIQERMTKGHMLWKFNNNSNIISYGIVDYFAEPYYPYYELKRCYEPLFVSVEWADHGYVWVTNDSTGDVKGKLAVRLFDMEANCYVQEICTEVSVRADESRPVVTLDEFGQFRRRLLVCAKLYVDETEAAGCIDWYEMEKKLHFPVQTGIDIRQAEDEVVVSAKRFVRCVELGGNDGGDEFGWLFSDNYFDLLPGEEKHIRVLGEHRQGTITAKGFYAKDSASVCWQKP